MKPILFATLACLFCAADSLRAADAKTNWEANCTSCHGKEGKSDTTMGKALKAKDLTDPAVQASFTDAKAVDSIKNGVKENGQTTMRAFGETFTEDEIKALVAYVRALKK